MLLRRQTRDHLQVPRPGHRRQRAPRSSEDGAPGTTLLNGITVAMVFLGLACFGDGGGGGGASGPPSEGAPGDRWFRAVVAGETGSGEEVTGALDIVIFDPQFADRRPAGTVGSDPSKRDVVGFCYYPDGSVVLLRGIWEPTGRFELSGDGWSFDGAIDGVETRGGFTGPNGGLGEFAGFDSATFDTGRFCGSYEGAGSGTWNFVVRDDGAVVGSFAGSLGGTLRGTANGDDVTLDWSGMDSSGSGAGTAAGTIDDVDRVQGDWSGTHGGSDVSGSWQGAECVGPPPPQRVPEQEPCPCGPQADGQSVVWCCEGQPCCSPEFFQILD